MLKARSQSAFFVFAITDFSASLFAFALAMFLRFVIQDPSLEELRDLNVEMYLFLALVLAVVQVSGFVVMGLYNLKRGISFGDEASRVVAAVVFNVLFVIAGFYFLRIRHISRFTLIYYAGLDVVVVLAARETARYLLGRLRAAGNKLRQVLIVGTGPAARKVADIMTHHRILGFAVQGYLVADDDPASDASASNPDGRTAHGYPVLGTLSQLERIIAKHQPDMVMYTLGDQGGTRLAALLDLCDQAGVSLMIVPGFAGLVAAKGEVETLEGLPVISIREVPARSGSNRFLKRAFDILFSFTVIVLLSPLFILSALAIKLTSRGPVFYKQERVGLDNRPFNMLKFRTMRVQTKKDSDSIWTTKNDRRVTPVGAIMRKLSIDELPQFFNVLLGNMSVVGPRPERPFFVSQFKDKYHHYMRRHSVKAGITGWAQIHGLRGDTSIQERIEADIYYIENWSFWLDLKIILMTPFKGMVNENAY